MFMGDNGGVWMFPARQNDPEHPNSQWLGPLMPELARAGALTNPMPLLLCPTAARRCWGWARRAIWMAWASLAPPTAVHPQCGNGVAIDGNYQYNGWLFAANPPTPRASAMTSPPMRRIIFSRFRLQPAQTPVLADGTWDDAWPLESDPPAKNLYLGLPAACHVFADGRFLGLPATASQSGEGSVNYTSIGKPLRRGAGGNR